MITVLFYLRVLCFQKEQTVFICPVKLFFKSMPLFFLLCVPIQQLVKQLIWNHFVPMWGICSNVHQEPLLQSWRHGRVIGNEKAYCSTIPTAVSAMDVKAFEFLKWFSTTSCNKWICNCIYHRCARGCFPSESKQCAILSEHKIIPRGLCRTKSQTYCIAEIWNKHDAQCQRCQCMHGGRKPEQGETRGVVQLAPLP